MTASGSLRLVVTLFIAGFDQGDSFMLVEIVDDEMYFQAISDQGKTVDSGVIRRRKS